MAYIVRTQDVDGSSRRSFKTLAGALRRFDDMAGHSVEAAFYERTEIERPAAQITSVSTVSSYGTRVTFEATDEHAALAVQARADATAAAAAKVEAAKQVDVPCEPWVGSVYEPLAEWEAKNLSPVATPREADTEFVGAVGFERAMDAWILSDRDVWYANPFYNGPKQPHPEDYQPDEEEAEAEEHFYRKLAGAYDSHVDVYQARQWAAKFAKELPNLPRGWDDSDDIPF